MPYGQNLRNNARIDGNLMSSSFSNLILDIENIVIELLVSKKVAKQYIICFSTQLEDEQDASKQVLKSVEKQCVNLATLIKNTYLSKVPPNLAHGFLAADEGASVLYKCTSNYNPTSQLVLAWNDPDLAVEWPLPPGQEPVLSARDRAGLSWGDFLAALG